MEKIYKTKNLISSKVVAKPIYDIVTATTSILTSSDVTTPFNN